MNIVLSWLAIAGAAVLLAAVAVAWWEHRRRVAARPNNPAWFDTQINFSARSATANLDLSLDHPHGQPANPFEPSDLKHEQSARQAVLTAALGRMARHKTEPAQRNAWADTQPLVNAAPSGSANAVARTAVE